MADTSAPPLGVSVSSRGATFALRSREAERVELCLFDGNSREIRHPLCERTDDIWHDFVPGITAGQRYGYRVYGPYAPDQGLRFNGHKLLIDPYARALAGDWVWNDAIYGYTVGHPLVDLSFDTRDSARFVPKSVVTAEAPARRPRTIANPKPWAKNVVYELHVKGFTKLCHEIPPLWRGTLAGLASEAAVAHLVRLGVTAVELLPVHSFVSERPLVERGLANYWGYNPFAFFAPHRAYLATGDNQEFANAVDSLHAAGISVILDVVFNHTAEGGAIGPTVSFRGIDNRSYYRLDSSNPRHYVNDTGCGNTMNGADVGVARMIADSLRHWVEAYGVDGFRFDLATALTRTESAVAPSDAPLFRMIADDPVLCHTPMIAEPWDATADGHGLGAFPTGWSEWNDRYRQSVRRFWGNGMANSDVAYRTSGSSDIFNHNGRRPSASINYVISHDGFTLSDFVSYGAKKNWANGEDNTDGDNAGDSFNCGIEGLSGDPQVQALRRKQKRNLLATLLLSRGVPMLRGGDEFSQSQRGNNNAYCQDNEISWLDWQTAGHPGDDLSSFIARLIRFRNGHESMWRDAFLDGADDGSGEKDIVWLTPEGRHMTHDDWHLPGARCLAFLLKAKPSDIAKQSQRILVVLNSADHSLTFQLPNAGSRWWRFVDTASEAGWQNAPDAEFGAVIIADRSVTVFVDNEEAGAAERSSLDALATRHGVADGYRTITGSWRPTDAGTKQALLIAMGALAANSPDPSAALALLNWHQTTATLAPVTIVHPARGDAVALHLNESSERDTVRWTITLENGKQRSGTIMPHDLPLHSEHLSVVRLWNPPSDLPHGHHRLRLDGGAVFDGTSDGALIVAPETCHRPDWLDAGDRRWGLSIQLYGLRSERNWGIGDFSDLAALVEQAADLGANAIQLSPLHALFPDWPEHASPYSPSSRLFLNPLYIDVEAIADVNESAEAQALIGTSKFKEGLAALRATPRVDYRGVMQQKFVVLRLLFASFRARHLTKRSKRARQFAAFRAKGGQALADFAAFSALSTAFSPDDWRAWPVEYQSPTSPAVARFIADHADDVDFAVYLQWLASDQLRDAAAHARKRMAIGLIADLAIGGDASGADAWRDQNLMAMAVELGAPPDPLGEQGQAWGCSPPRPQVMRKRAYLPFAALLDATMEWAGGIRIDHVMGLERQFWVPRGRTGRDGAYVNVSFDEMSAVLALESARHRCLVIGEDLGTVPDGFRDRMAAAGILSTRVLYFERESDGTFRVPLDYPRLSASYAGTHDLPPIVGFVESRDIDAKAGIRNYATTNEEMDARAERERSIANLRHATGIDTETDIVAFGDAIHGFIARTNSALAVIQLEDVIGQADQANLPGTTDQHPNWRRKYTVAVDAIAGHPAFERVSRIMNSGRIGSKSGGPTSEMAAR